MGGVRLQGTPLYVQVADDLRSKIISGAWQPGGRIPPEMELCERYHVSRITVRGALDQLVSERLLTRLRAKGTFVRHWDTDELADDHLTLATNVSSSIQELGDSIVTISASLGREVPNKKIGRILHLEGDQCAMVLRRVRVLKKGTGGNAHPFGLFVTWFTPVEGMPEDTKRFYGSFTEILRERGIVLDKSKDCIEAIRPPIEVQDALEVSPNTPILKRTKTSWMSTGAYYEYSECYYVGDQYKYYVDFS